MIRIRQTCKGQLIFFEVRFELLAVLRASDQNLDISFNESVIVAAQLRQVLPAERSFEAPVHDEQDVSLTPKLTEFDAISVEIPECKIRGRFINGNFCHRPLSYHTSGQ